MRQTYTCTGLFSVLFLVLAGLSVPAQAQSSDPFGPDRSRDDDTQPVRPGDEPSVESLEPRRFRLSEEAKKEAAKAAVEEADRRLARSDDESVYVVQRRAYSKRGKFELTPMVYQRLNFKFSSYTGLALSAGYHFRENLAIEVVTNLPVPGLFFASYSNLVTELFDEENLQPEAVDLKQLAFFAGTNLNFSALYGKFNIYGELIDYDFYTLAGFGITQTRERCSPAQDGEVCDPFQDRQDIGTRAPADSSDEYRLSGHLGGGLRLFFRDWIGLRVELRDIVYADRAVEANEITTDIANNLFVFAGASFLL
ncbi:MAG: outer membrane beta-barrel domain-containing protein [Myxococcota bacterium]